MPDSIPGLLELIRQVGSGPFFLAAIVLILLRVATPDAIRGAIGRLYGDFAPVIQGYFKAKSNAREAEAARDRAIESHWHAHPGAHPTGPAAADGSGAGVGAGPAQPAELGAGALPVAEIQAAVEGCPHTHCPVRSRLGASVGSVTNGQGSRGE